VRVVGDAALVSGVKRARVVLDDGQTADSATAFVDLFVRRGGGWRLQHRASFELPATAG
jgi:ketosteroid isomerase-like protein